MKQEQIVVPSMYHSPDNPVVRVPCDTCHAASGEPCTSTLPSALGGSVGVKLNGYHASRLDVLKRWAA